MITHVSGSLVLSTIVDDTESSHDQKNLREKKDDEVIDYLKGVSSQVAKDSQMKYHFSSTFVNNEVKQVISLNGDFKSDTDLKVGINTLFSYLNKYLSYDALVSKLGNTELIYGSVEIEVDEDVYVVAYDPEDTSWKMSSIKVLNKPTKEELELMSSSDSSFSNKSVVLKYLDDRHLSIDKGTLPESMVLTMLFTSLIALYTKDGVPDLELLKKDVTNSVDSLLNKQNDSNHGEGSMKVQITRVR